MFTSKDDLKLNYGIDMEIGKFFVDRKIPENNLYWKGRYLYITPMPGYLFIPLYTDLQCRLGLPKSRLLSEGHIVFMEKIMHSIAKQEFDSIPMDEHVKECIEITKPVCRNNLLLDELASCFLEGQVVQKGISFGTPLRALNRVDSYLFTLCYFDVDDEQKKHLIDAWHACMTFYLITDDLDDIKKDFEEKEDNAIIEAGLDENGAKLIESYMQQSYNTMNKINPVFANRMDYSWQQINVWHSIQQYLKSVN
ncbi:MAG: hypothetical protein KF862_10005 [Chitinophagaceae bacterium]|nr:hypothetical protein [Chitinophagaceae bacterium]